MKTLYTLVSSAIILLGGLFVIDSLASWDSFAVVSASAGWAVTVTGILHLFIALGGRSDKPVLWLAVLSGSLLVVLVICGWVFASFAFDWPEVVTVVFTVSATILALVEKR